MNHKRTWIEKFSDFVSGKGFYLVVLICVAAIALSGYYLVQGVRGGVEDTLDQPVAGSAAIVDQPSQAPTGRPTPKPTDPPAVSTARITAPPSAAPTPTAEPTPSAAPEPTPSLAPAPLVFTWPVKGVIIADFSVEALAYDETMGDWRTHGGLDIAAPLGTQVLCAANGTVSAIRQDDMMGTVVEIDHGQGGLKSLYANLAAVPTVSVGDEVTTGTVIGSVGDTAAAESGRQAHLHYALLKDGQAVNPADYLPQQ